LVINALLMTKLFCTGRIHPLFALLLVLIVAFPVGFYGLYLFIVPSLPDIAQLKTSAMKIPLQVYSKDNKLIGEFGEKISYPVSYAEIPPLMVDAFLAAEDSSFFAHNGVSFKGLGRAVTEAVRSGSSQTGGSTITMQVAKNYYLSPERTLRRKLTEIFLARKIEQNLTKQEIFSLYVNKIFLGQHAYGIAAAANVYYQKPLKNLTLAEMAMIAGLPKAPTKYNPVNDPVRAMERRNWIIGRMLQLGFITQNQYKQSISAPLNLSYSYSTKRLDADMPYVAEMVRSAMVDEFGADVLNSGYRVYTTISYDHQQMAVDAVHKGLEAYDRRHGWRGAESTTKPLANFRVINNLWPAQVTQVSGNSFEATFANGLKATVPWSGMSWARRYHSTDHVGEPPKNAKEIVKVNDIIRLRPDMDGDKVRKIMKSQMDAMTSDSISDKEKPAAEPKKTSAQGAWSGINWALDQIPAAEAQLISLDPNNGAIQAVVGGYDFSRSNFNRSIQGWRQPGSNIKPFIYSLALERGYTPLSIISDSPVQIGKWRPQNSDGKFMGPITLRRALYLSRNMVSIRLLQAIGVDRAVEHLNYFGLTKNKLPKNLALALGAAQVLPIQLATGYATFANGGYRIQPYFIERIENYNKDVLFQANPVRVCHECGKPAAGSGSSEMTSDPDESNTVPAEQPAKGLPKDYPKAQRILSVKTAEHMNSILRDVIAHGTGYAAMRLGRQDLGGKTGTTNDAKDAWFSGFNPNLVAVAWVGFDQPRTLGRKEYGGVAALPIWSEYMARALANSPEKIMPPADTKPATTSESEEKPEKVDTLEDEVRKFLNSKTDQTNLVPKQSKKTTQDMDAIKKFSPSSPLESDF
jgi:penicillin-binding protein 1A